MSKTLRIIAPLIALLVLLSALGCGGPTGREALYGKWNAENESGTLIFDFKRDGNLLLSGSAYGDQTVDATFEFLDEDTFTVKIPAFNNYESTADFKIEGDHLTIVSDGETVIFTRTK